MDTFFQRTCTCEYLNPALMRVTLIVHLLSSQCSAVMLFYRVCDCCSRKWCIFFQIIELGKIDEYIWVVTPAVVKSSSSGDGTLDYWWLPIWCIQAGMDVNVCWVSSCWEHLVRNTTLLEKCFDRELPESYFAGWVHFCISILPRKHDSWFLHFLDSCEYTIYISQKCTFLALS